jgi:hypothetical protein
MPPVVTPPEIRRYLLGQLDESRAAALESQYFADPALFDEVWAVEHDLVDEYVSNALRAAERAQFERHYLSTDVHRKRVATARALLARASAAPPARVIRGPWHGRPVLRWAMAAALTALFLAAIWLIRPAPAPVEQASGRPETPGAPAGPRTPAKPGDPAQPSPGPADAANSAHPPVLLTVTLPSVLTRASEQTVVKIPATTEEIELRLEGARDARQQRVHVEVRTVDGRTAWRGIASPAETGSGLIASVRVPPDRLRPDDYIVTASDVDQSGVRTELARYAVRVSAQ